MEELKAYLKSALTSTARHGLLLLTLNLVELPGRRAPGAGVVVVDRAGHRVESSNRPGRVGPQTSRPFGASPLGLKNASILISVSYAFISFQHR